MDVVLKHLGLCVFMLYMFQIQRVVLADDDEVDCIDFAMEDLTPCKDWENTLVDFDVKLDVDENNHGTYNGIIVIKEAIHEGVEIAVAIFLITPNGDELIYSAAGEICQTLYNKEALWGEFADALNTTCPIPKGEYILKDVKVNFDAMKPLIIRDNIGQYKIKTTVQLAIKKFMCVLLTAEIYEETRLLSECPNPPTV